MAVSIKQNAGVFAFVDDIAICLIFAVEYLVNAHVYGLATVVKVVQCVIFNRELNDGPYHIILGIKQLSLYTSSFKLVKWLANSSPSCFLTLTPKIVQSLSQTLFYMSFSIINTAPK